VYEGRSAEMVPIVPIEVVYGRTKPDYSARFQVIGRDIIFPLRRGFQ
jgi:hypothetical protein